MHIYIHRSLIKREDSAYESQWFKIYKNSNSHRMIFRLQS